MPTLQHTLYCILLLFILQICVSVSVCRDDFKDLLETVLLFSSGEALQALLGSTSAPARQGQRLTRQPASARLSFESFYAPGLLAGVPPNLKTHDPHVYTIEMSPL